MSFSVGEIVHVIEADGTKVLAQIIELVEDAHGALVAFVHRLQHDGIAVATEQTATGADPKVPVVAKLDASSTPVTPALSGSTLGGSTQ